jgi:hypothetical protein
MLNVRRGRRGVGVAKLCIDVPDSLYNWLKEIAKEMATTPEMLITQYLWLLHGVGEATLRSQCKGERVKSEYSSY